MTTDLADVIALLSLLFPGSQSGIPICDIAADTNDDDRVDISDAVYMLLSLFGGTVTLPAPHPQCGSDPTPGELTCENPPICP